jgi:hypothetical protein
LKTKFVYLKTRDSHLFTGGIKGVPPYSFQLNLSCLPLGALDPRPILSQIHYLQRREKSRIMGVCFYLACGFTAGAV